MRKLLFIASLLWLVGITANAEEIPNDEIWYEASGKLTEVTYQGNYGLHTNAFNTSILSHTFSGGKGVIKFNGNVTSLGTKAFYSCLGLTSVTIPNSVTNLGWSAFRSCSNLTSITIPNSVTSIGKETFYYCSNLTSVTIPNSVKSIGDYAFCCSGLTSITIPDSVTSIGHYAFNRCYGLTSITITKSVTSIGDYAFEYCSGLTSIAIPDSVKNIGCCAFEGCSNLTSITIPSSVASIGNGAFYGCNFTLSEFVNNSSLDEVSKSYWGARICDVIQEDGLCIKNNVAISHRGKPSSITIPNTVTSIGEWAFDRCTCLTSITIPNSVTSIGDYAFSYCSGLTSITIPNSVTSIGHYAFEYCSGLTSIAIPNSVKSIGDFAFEYCSGLTSVTIPNSVTSIGKSAFECCTSLTSIIIPDSVTSIGNSTFGACRSLTSVTIPNSVTSIGYAAFSGCSGLTSINIPNSVTSIGNYAFYCGPNLTSFTVNWTEEEKIVVPPLDAFYDIHLLSNFTLHVPSHTKELYKAANVWNNFGTIVNDNCVITDNSGNEEQYELSDGDHFQIKDDSRKIEVLKDIDLSQLTYSRTFKNTNWQPLYVPFDMDVTSELLGNFSFAKYAGTYTEDDGTFCITIAKLNEGSKIKANTPYFIKAKVADSSNPQTISIEGTTLHATAETENYMLSAEKKVSIFGIYNKKTFTAEEVAEKNVYGYGGGTYNPQTAGQTLGAFRFYIKLTNREDNMYGTDTPSSIKLKVLGDDDATSIDALQTSTESDNNIYDLSGRAVSNPKHGVYIKNGKKYYVK